jgi:hypothetical protein
MKRIGLLALLASLAFAVTAMAAATQTYRGTTDQGRKAYVKSRDGSVTSANVPWIFKAGDCTPHNGYSLGDGKPYIYVATTATPITNNGPWFRAHRHEVFKVKGGGKATIDGKLHGHFTGKHATGTSMMKATSNDSHGQHTCTRTIHFSVKLSG